MILVWGVIAGLLVGAFSGLVGIAGGVILVPILLYAFKMDQRMAQGTSLAILLPPTGLLAFLEYYKSGNAHLKLGLMIALGIFIGGYFGGKWAQSLSDVMLRKVFAVVLVGTAVKMFFQK
jgi:uncharacterized membrane protein YfcA